MNAQPSCCNLRDWGITILRVIVGVVFILHGCQKLFIYQPANVAGSFKEMGIPGGTLTAYFTMFAEFGGGVMLLLGLLTRIGALLIAVVMVGAIVTVHGKNGFFLPAGVEYVLVLLAAAVALMLAGSGPLAVDNLLFKRDHPDARGPARPQPQPK